MVVVGVCCCQQRLRKYQRHQQNVDMCVSAFARFLLYIDSCCLEQKAEQPEQRKNSTQATKIPFHPTCASLRRHYDLNKNECTERERTK